MLSAKLLPVKKSGPVDGDPVCKVGKGSSHLRKVPGTGSKALGENKAN